MSCKLCKILISRQSSTKTTRGESHRKAKLSDGNSDELMNLGDIELIEMRSEVSTQAKQAIISFVDNRLAKVGDNSFANTRFAPVWRLSTFAG